MSNRKKCFAIAVSAPLNRDAQQAFFSEFFNDWKLHASYDGDRQFVVYASKGPFESRDDLKSGFWDDRYYLIVPYGFWPDDGQSLVTF